MMYKDGFIKKGPSKQDLMSESEIAQDLEKYKEIDDLDEVQLTKHVRYFAWDKKTNGYKYRKGGFLLRKDDPRYVVLSASPYENNVKKPRWSVQRSIAGHKTIFFKLMAQDEYDKENLTVETDVLSTKYQQALQEKEVENEMLKKELLKLKAGVL